MENVANLTFDEFCRKFATEGQCAEALFAAKWPNGFCCPRCEHSKAYPIKSRRLLLLQCILCKCQTSLIAGTIMERTRTPLRLWFQAMYLHARPDGINAKQLADAIQVTYKTAWLICHKLRYAMSQAEAELMLSGLVKVTDAVLNPRLIPPADQMWFNVEQAVLAGVSETENGETTHMKIKWCDKKKLADRHSSPNAEPFIAKYVDPEAKTVVTRRYDRREKVLIGRPLREVCRKAGRWLAWQFGGIGPKHLQVYLDHFCYMFNRQGKTIFELLLQDCATRPTITYPVLTGTGSRRASERTRPAAETALAS